MHACHIRLVVAFVIRVMSKMHQVLLTMIERVTSDRTLAAGLHRVCEFNDLLPEMDRLDFKCDTTRCQGAT